nr:glycerophosphodiester phosphodiesterase [Pseudenhygromyxa sp. WMMC2535]
MTILGHRGDPRHENTLRGLRECLAVGLDGAEVDARLLADGTVVLFHDRRLERLTGDPRSIAGLSQAELAEVRVFGDPLPTLEALLAEWPKDRWLVIELKEGGGEALVDATLALTSGRERIILSSFDHELLAAASARGCTHELVLNLDVRSPMWLHADGGQRFGCAGVHLHASLVSRPTVARYVARGMQVGFWGAFDRDHEERLSHLGVVRVITDFVVDSRLA